MSPLTPQQRIEAYEYAKEKLSKEWCSGVCVALKVWFCVYDISGIVYDIHFPEFFAQRPTTSGTYWWPKSDKQSRLDALDRAIELAKKQIQ